MSQTVQPPKFEIGQKVWAASTSTAHDKWPCPDCNGTKTWTAKTATGEEINIRCPRCEGLISINGFPSLDRIEIEVFVREYTIGSIQMNTAKEDGRIYSYMCEETGVGSGTVHSEGEDGRGLYETHDEAAIAAHVLRAEDQANQDARPRSLRTAEFATKPLKAALQHEWREELYHAWERAKHYRGFIDEVLAGEDGLRISKDVREILEYATEDTPWLRAHPIDTLIHAAWNALSDLEGMSAQPDLRDALKALEAEEPVHATR